MSASIQQLIPEMRPFASELVRIAGANGLQPRVTSTYRSTQQQTKLYRQFLAGASKYPVAPPGTSAHEFGYAMDMIVSDLSYLPDLGGVWQGWGGVWGGAFNDPIHFEFPGFSKPAQQDPTRQEPTSIVETAAGLFTPGVIGLTQDFLGIMQSIFPSMSDSDALYYLTHPWRGMDWLLPNWLLDERQKVLGF